MKYRLAILISIALILAGCGAVGMAHDAEFESEYKNTEEDFENVYTSSAELVFKSLDGNQSTVDFFDIGSMNTVTLSYNGATVVNDKFGQPMNIYQLNEGDIVDIAYDPNTARVGAILLSQNAFVSDGISKYSIGDNGKSFCMGDITYSISEFAKVFSYGNLITVDQLLSHDNLVIQGIDNTIFSIRVEDGHGYLELVNEDALIGGWIEVGQTLISQIMDGMLFTVPEGEYTVKLTNDGIDEIRQVTISRNEVSQLDLSDIVSTLPERGLVRFSITPPEAAVYVDGNFVDTSYALKMPVGIHDILVEAPGYDTVIQYFEVTGLNQMVEIALDVSGSSSSTTGGVSGNSISKNLYALLTIESPEDAEVYEDNIYKGISPVTYQKTAGTHTLTFRKKGYITTSYTVTIEDDGRDQTLSFPEMSLEENDSTSNGNSKKTVSGNTVSGNTVSGNTVGNKDKSKEKDKAEDQKGDKKTVSGNE